MGFVFKRRLTATQVLEERISRLEIRLKELWQDRIVPSGSEISAIIEGSYIPTTSDGAGELNGVPTQTDIEKIIAGSFVHYEPPIDEFAVENVPSEAEINKIIKGEFSGENYTPVVPSVNDINAIINGTYGG